MKSVGLGAIKAVLYDMDGLLLDTEGIYTAVTQAIVHRYGLTFDWSHKRHMIGRPALDSARYLVTALSLPLTPEAYLTEREALLVAQFPHAEAFPGALRLVSHLRDVGIKQAVATSSSARLFAVKTQRHGALFGLFDAIVTGDEVAVGKPAPDIFLEAARRLGVEPAACLVMEDAPAGVQAAKAAGMAVVAVPDPAMDRQPYGAADWVLDCLADFDPAIVGLPPFSAS